MIYSISIFVRVYLKSDFLLNPRESIRNFLTESCGNFMNSYSAQGILERIEKESL